MTAAVTTALAANHRLPASHALLALAVVAVWGTNFVVIRWALEVFTPLWLAVLRFGLAVLPALLALMGLQRLGIKFLSGLPKPAASWRNLLAYGALIGAGQFGLLYSAMNGHIAPGIASLVIQTQVFFTIGLAMLVRGERLQAFQGVALLLAVAGLVLIGTHTDGLTTPLGVGMTLFGALCWAAGNIVSQRVKGVSALAYVVWSSFGALPPLLVLAWWMEGPQVLMHALHAANLLVWLAVVWQAVGNALFGYAAWSWLLQRHATATVVPWALLVPVFGMASAVIALGEPMPWWKLLAAALVIGGLTLNVLWPMAAARRG